MGSTFFVPVINQKRAPKLLSHYQIANALRKKQIIEQYQTKMLPHINNKGEQSNPLLIEENKVNSDKDFI